MARTGSGGGAAAGGGLTDWSPIEPRGPPKWRPAICCCSSASRWALYTPTPWLNREPSASVIMPRAGRAGAVCRRGFDASSLRRSAAAAIALADGGTFTLEKRARPSAAAVDARLTAVDARWPPVAADIRAREMREATASSRQPEDVSASDCRASSDITNGLSESRRAVESTSMPTPGVSTLGRRGRGGAAFTDARRAAAASAACPADPRRLCAPCGCAARFFISVLVRTMSGLPPAEDVGDSPGSGAMVETRDACSSAFMSDDCRRESSIFAFTSSWSSSFDAWRIAAISARELCFRESCGASAGGGGTQPASSSLCVDIRAESDQGNCAGRGRRQRCAHDGRFPWRLVSGRAPREMV